MSRFLSYTRYLILIPIVGLTIAAAFFFVFGGIGLIYLIFELLLGGTDSAHEAAEVETGLLIFEVVEYVHTFLVGTVLFITAMGLFQLFIKAVDLPGWLKVDSTEELETNLIGVTVAVLAVNFMGVTFAENTENVLLYGAGIALPIAALGVFVGLRAWALKLTKQAHPAKERQPYPVDKPSAIHEATEQ